MTTERVRRRIQANSTVVADGLEKLQSDILDLFNSQLDKYRHEMLERDDTHIAMLSSLVNEIGALKQGVIGLSQQISEYEAIIPPSERKRAVAMIADHEERLQSLEWGPRDGI
jgi:hypothetical protein